MDKRRKRDVGSRVQHTSIPTLHEQTSGGDPSILRAKSELRHFVWDKMESNKIAKFPGAHNRIPNFVGSERAAERLASIPEWQRAQRVKSNPDSPQWPCRQKALEESKLLYMAVPQLKDICPFFVLDPARLKDDPRTATTIKHAFRSAEKLSLSDMLPVDVVIMGSVAVSSDGRRIGKGGGFSDLEFALASAAGLISEQTVIVTTVHDCQVLESGRILVTEHDVLVDVIVTPTQVIRTETKRKQAVIIWEDLTTEKIASIPLLLKLSQTCH